MKLSRLEGWMAAVTAAVALFCGVRLAADRAADGCRVLPQHGERTVTVPVERVYRLDTPVDVNTADLNALQLLPSIGQTKAQAILDYRTANGPFASLDELTNVPGIGPATLEALRPHVILSAP